MKNGSNREISKVLIIDDDENIRRLVQGCLLKNGFDVLTASQGEEGITKAFQERPDLIVCDLTMPGMDGFEVLETLRHDTRLADTPVIFLTGQSEPSQVRQGMNLGADDYLTKPVEVSDLLAAIRARLSRSQAEQRRREKQLERAMQAFAQIVHDLRDPLFVVLGCADLLQSDTAAPAAEEERSQAILERMQRGVLRMQAIISETLFLAKSRMQRLPFDPAPMDLRSFCEQLVSNHEGGSRLHFHGEPGSYPLTADPLRLQQALENLITNSLKYSEESVEIRLTKDETNYRITISDRGIGIPDPEQANVFEPFFRASNTSSKPGHGLGLSIVKSCIEQLGGRIDFQSELNKGTTFLIEIPKTPKSDERRPDQVPAPIEDSSKQENRVNSISALSKSVKPESETEALPKLTPQDVDAPKSSQQAGPMTAIIVDDDALVRSVLRDLLDSSKDVKVVGEAGTLAQAQTLAKHHKPTVVFLDVNLPDGSGFELLPQLGEESSVVFVTSAEEHAVQAFDCEAADYVLKPVSLERLQQALSRVRQRWAAKAADSAEQASGSFLVKTLTEKRLVEFREIRSIVAYGEYSRVTWGKDKGALLRKSLKQWQAELPSTQFIRVHRQAIVNLVYMDRIEKLPGGKMRVHVRDSAKPFPVSLRLAPILNRKLKTLGH